jgi:hypothetical protein
MAIEQETIDLINAEIDGTISMEGRASLDRLVAQSPEIRALREDLRSVCTGLDRLELLDPPAELVDDILLRTQQSSRAVAGNRGVAAWLAGLFGIPVVRYGLSFATGVIVTFSLISSDQASREAFDDVTSLVGTMSADRGASGPLTTEDSLSLTLSELAGSVDLKSSGSLMILDFDLVSEFPVEIVATFDDRDIWFNGFAQLESQGTSVAAASGRVTVRMEGQRRYAVYLHNAGQDAATVRLEFATADGVFHEGELSSSVQK